MAKIDSFDKRPSNLHKPALLAYMVLPTFFENVSATIGREA